jgi:hypothetical protein
MNSTKNYGNSSFWMDRFDKSGTDFETPLGQSNNELYKLAGQKRAISNFVSIVTNQRIPVQFATTGDSYTDGESVVISSRLNSADEFDVAVGLALHEGSHIKLSDFKLLQSLTAEIYSLDDYDKLSNICWMGGVDIIHTIKDILNWVEDRRIDNYIYSSSPGYRAYYQALYDKYFNDSLIDKGLSSNELTDETFDSYMFRLINLHSKFSRLNALKGLKRIFQIADLKNIGRLKDTKDAFNVAVDIFRVICENVEVAQKANQSQNSKQDEGDESNSQSQSSENDASDGDNEETQSSGNKSKSKSKSKSKEKSKEKSEDGDSNEGADSDETSNDVDKSNSNGNGEMDDETFEDLLNSIENGGGDKSDETSNGGKSIGVDNLPDNFDGDDVDTDDVPVEAVSLTDNQKRILEKKIKKQKEFIRGEIKKTKLSKGEAKTIDVLEKSGAEFVEVGKEYKTHNSVPTINCILVKNVTRDLMETDEFPFSHKTYSYKNKGYELYDRNTSAVADGIRLGTILGKKMQVRSESRDTVFNRQLTGKLDKRMVASLGYGNTQAFYTKETDMFNKVNLHISVDASSSMSSGNMWNNTITNVVALAKAVDMISNLDIQISFRSTSNDGLPYIAVAYDSRKDKFNKVKQLFPYITPYGTTPEGLCFEAIQKYMIGSSTGLDSYFLNISDGEPYYYGKDIVYSGYAAAAHTKKMVDGFRGMGIKVLSYFISQTRNINENSLQARIFTECYGKSAKFIDVTSVSEVSRTVNKLFMEK